MQTRPPVAMAALNDFGADRICELVRDGVSLTEISERVGVSKGSLLRWMHEDLDRSARIHQARRETAWHWDEEAEKTIRRAQNDQGELTRARELAHHYRWRAAKINPQYGDKTAVTNADGTGDLVINIQRFGKKAREGGDTDK